ncbi:MAG: hypothetical protein Q8R96_05105 [Bacteroidota bacterium]|nr:hypothetical protein [Bacteroidota bacterium]
MNENNEFQEIGKNTSYKVPAGFFEQVSEKTLLKAKQREFRRRKKLVLWRTVAVAASLAAVFFIGYFTPDRDIKQKSNPIVMDNQLAERPIIQNPEIIKQTTVPEQMPDRTIAEESNSEEIDDILADLSDDELLQLAAMFTTDPIVSESAQ